ncbi:hypothetical protein ACFZCK_11780 [Kitasatospora purpeofusca]|uniref:hypothetical protein n=1 Tax=Kitasatospora purpeofusca TaxID=67352 RepID=UPI0036EF04FC
MPQLNPFPHDGDGGLGPSASAKGWHQGYIAAVSSPSELPRTPLVRSGEFMDAFRTGAAAGRADGLAEGWRWRYFGEDARTGEDTGQGPQPARSPVEPVDAGEDGPAGPAYPLAWRCVGAAALRVVLEQFAPGSDPEFPGLRLDRVCADKGVGRLYLPVRLLPRDPPAEPAGDPLADQGFWHGTAADSLTDAAAEGPDGPDAPETRAPTFLGLVRYRPAGEHDFWDLLPAGGRMPATHG